MKYIEYWENLKEANRILLILIGFLVVVIVFLISAIIFLSANREVTVYMPPYEKVKVGGRDYVLMWAKFFTFYITNYTPETVEERYYVLSTYAFDDSLKQYLIKESKRIKENRMSQQFIPYEGSWKLIPEKREIKVQGRLRKWIGDKEIRNELATFTLYIRIYGGKPFLVGFKYE